MQWKYVRFDFMCTHARWIYIQPIVSMIDGFKFQGALAALSSKCAHPTLSSSFDLENFDTFKIMPPFIRWLLLFFYIKTKIDLKKCNISMKLEYDKSKWINMILLANPIVIGTMLRS